MDGGAAVETFHFRGLRAVGPAHYRPNFVQERSDVADYVCKKTKNKTNKLNKEVFYLCLIYTHYKAEMQVWI